MNRPLHSDGDFAIPLPPASARFWCGASILQLEWVGRAPLRERACPGSGRAARGDGQNATPGRQHTQPHTRPHGQGAPKPAGMTADASWPGARWGFEAPSGRLFDVALGTGTPRRLREVSLTGSAALLLCWGAAELAAWI